MFFYMLVGTEDGILQILFKFIFRIQGGDLSSDKSTGKPRKRIFLIGVTPMAGELFLKYLDHMT